MRISDWSSDVCSSDLPEFPEVNHKKIYRLYREASLAVCRRRKVRRPPNERLPLAAASAPNAVCSMDFVSDALANGRRLKCLTVADDFTHRSAEPTSELQSLMRRSYAVFW